MHHDWLIKTLELAKKRKGFCSPNPSVGAIVVKNNQQLAACFHEEAGKEHAEYKALKQLKYPLTDAILYISLEPCSHWGKTPPCVDEIVLSGVSKVVYAYSDPNPLVKPFDTLGFLKSKGIECEQVCVPEITSFYKSYQYWLETKRPFVTLKIAQSLNGKTCLENGESVALTGEEINQFTHLQRRQTDIILTTEKTISNDNPLFTARIEGEVVNKPICVLDRNLKLINTDKKFKCLSNTVLFFYDQNLSTGKADKKLIPLTCEADELNLDEMLRYLGKKGFHDVWVEAGGTLASTLLKKKLVNRFYLYLSPCWLSSRSLDAYINTSGLSFEGYKSVLWEQVGQDMRVTFDF